MGKAHNIIPGMEVVWIFHPGTAYRYVLTMLRIMPRTTVLSRPAAMFRYGT